jgi:hypothetical protein
LPSHHPWKESIINLTDYPLVREHVEFLKFDADKTADLTVGANPRLAINLLELAKDELDAKVDALDYNYFLTLVSSVPADGATAVAARNSINLVFSQDVEGDDVDLITVTGLTGGNAAVTIGSFSIGSSGAFTVVLSDTLAENGNTVVLTIPPGALIGFETGAVIETPIVVSFTLANT